MSGLRGLKRVLDAGKVAAITPDGPRGPARVAATGPVALANLTGKPIIPVAWSVDRYWRTRLGLHDYTKTILPRYHDLGRYVDARWQNVWQQENSDVSTRDRMESQRKKLEAALNGITDRADRFFTNKKKSDGGKIITNA